MLPRKVEVDIGSQRRGRRFSCRQAIKLRRCLVEHLGHGGYHQGVFGSEMGVETAMRKPGLRHHARDTDPKRALGQNRLSSLLINPASGSLLMLRIVPHWPTFCMTTVILKGGHCNRLSPSYIAVAIRSRRLSRGRLAVPSGRASSTLGEVARLTIEVTALTSVPDHDR